MLRRNRKIKEDMPLFNGEVRREYFVRDDSVAKLMSFIPRLSMSKVDLGKVLHTLEYIALDFRHTILEFHLYAPDLGHTYAHRAMLCPRIQTDLCTPGNVMPQISGRLMHTGQ